MPSLFAPVGMRIYLHKCAKRAERATQAGFEEWYTSWAKGSHLEREVPKRALFAFQNDPNNTPLITNAQGRGQNLELILHQDAIITPIEIGHGLSLWEGMLVKGPVESDLPAAAQILTVLAERERFVLQHLAKNPEIELGKLRSSMESHPQAKKLSWSDLLQVVKSLQRKTAAGHDLPSVHFNEVRSVVRFGYPLGTARYSFPGGVTMQGLMLRHQNGETVVSHNIRAILLDFYIIPSATQPLKIFRKIGKVYPGAGKLHKPMYFN